MPPVTLCGTKQHFASDDVLGVATILATLNGVWCVMLMAFVAAYSAYDDCAMPATALMGGEAAINAALFLCDVGILAVSARGSILETSKRRLVAPLICVFFAFLVAAIAMRVTVTWLFFTESFWVGMEDHKCVFNYQDGDEDASHDHSEWYTYRLAQMLTWIHLAATVLVICWAFFSLPAPNKHPKGYNQRRFFGLCFLRPSQDPVTKSRLSPSRVITAAATMIAADLGLVVLDVLAGLILTSIRQNQQRLLAIDRAMAEPEETVLDVGKAASGLQAAGADSGQLKASRPTGSSPIHLLTPPSLPELKSSGSMRLLNDSVLCKEAVDWRKCAEATYYCKYAAAAYAAKLDIADRACHAMGDWESKSREEIREVAGLQPCELVHVKMGGMAPYFIARDRHTRSIVLSICGRGTMGDLLTDLLTQKPVPLAEYLTSSMVQVAQSTRTSGKFKAVALEMADTDGLFSGYCSRSLLNAAMEVIADLQQHNKLHDMLIRRQVEEPTSDSGVVVVRKTLPRLVVTGHSTGAGIASLVALKLHQVFPSIKAWCYCPPGSVLSPQQAQKMEGWCTSVVAGKDVVPRLGVSEITRLKAQILKSLALCKVNKWRVFWDHQVMDMKNPDATMHATVDAIPEEAAREWAHLQSVEHKNEPAGLEGAIAQCLPGRVLFLRPHKGVHSAVSQKPDAVIEGVWVSREDIQQEGILLSQEMLQVHHVSEVYLWLVDSLARSQLTGSTGMELPSGGAERDASPASSNMRRARSVTLRHQRAPSGGASGSSSASRAGSAAGLGPSLSQALELQELGMRVLDNWVPDTPTNREAEPSSSSWGQAGEMRSPFLITPVASRRSVEPALTTLAEELSEGPSSFVHSHASA
mmetsp:Transcript_6254/g.17494  ORF Transcript_6254/g.17494 Transcript_6254/m.17494 type:complete len:868 (-) Transcript_6254:316-2919(-)